MLAPDYLETLPDAFVKQYEQVCEDILTDMARKINAYDYYCAAAQHQRQRAIALGMLSDEITEKLSALTRKSKPELNRMFLEACTQALQADDAIHAAAGKTITKLSEVPALKNLLNAGARATHGTFQNLTRTTANTATKQFENALDRAWMQIQSGAFSSDAAIRTAIKDLCQQGVGAIQYASGHVDTVEVAVRRAVVTGINKTACALQLERAYEMGCDLVQTTAHAGARPSHAVWQGQVFSISGDSEKYENFADATGYGTGAGLGGWNCRHSFFPYYEGASRVYSPALLQEYEAKKYTYNGKAMNEYEATQQQRYIERQIRRWKRENAAMKATGQDTIESAAKFKKWNAVYQDFLQQTGLKRQDGRLVISIGTGIAKPEQSGILKESEEQAIKKYISAYSYQINDALRSGEVLTAEQAAFVKELDSALNKMPVYQGTVYRSVNSEYIEDIESFWKIHTINTRIKYLAYTSASTEIYDDSMDIQMVIKSKTGHDIRTYNSSEMEILFLRDSEFYITNIKGNIIYMEEK